nr:hypothetical protein Itr_chr12CG01100 [Ipomoea trifida]
MSGNGIRIICIDSKSSSKSSSIKIISLSNSEAGSAADIGRTSRVLLINFTNSSFTASMSSIPCCRIRPSLKGLWASEEHLDDPWKEGHVEEDGVLDGEDSGLRGGAEELQGDLEEGGKDIEAAVEA